MSKHYHTIWMTFLGVMAIGLSATLSPHGLWSGHGFQGGVSLALAGEDSHGHGAEGHDEGGHGEEGYDHEGYNHEGYDREGYRDDGHHRDGHYDSAHDRHKSEDKK